METTENELTQELQQRATRGDATAQFELAQAHEHGVGVSRDPLAALEWYLKAAAQGHVEAQFQAASHCQRLALRHPGAPVTEMRIESYKWFKLAAENGHPKAAYHRDLSALHMKREEVEEGRRRAALVTAHPAAVAA